MSKPHDGNTTGPLAARRDRVTSPAERRVADFLVEAGARAAPLSAMEIADAAGTSDATVVRTARSLGYPDLRALRHALATEDATDLPTRLRATIADSPSAHDVLATAVERQVESLESLLRRVSPADFDAAAQILAGAAHIWWCGTGPSAHLASYAAFLCRRLGTASGALTHAGTDHADELLAVRPGHAVVVLAYGRLHPYVKVLLHRAAEIGAPVVLITDAVGPQLRAPVAVRLNAGRGSATRFATHGPTIVLLEALILATAAADPARADTAVNTLNSLRRALAGKPLDVDPR